MICPAVLQALTDRNTVVAETVSETDDMSCCVAGTDR